MVRGCLRFLKKTNVDPLTTCSLNNLLRLIGCLLHFARCISLAARSTRTGMSWRRSPRLISDAKPHPNRHLQPGRPPQPVGPLPGRPDRPLGHRSLLWPAYLGVRAFGLASRRPRFRIHPHRSQDHQDGHTMTHPHPRQPTRMVDAHRQRPRRGFRSGQRPQEIGFGSGKSTRSTSGHSEPDGITGRPSREDEDRNCLVTVRRFVFGALFFLETWP